MKTLDHLQDSLFADDEFDHPSAQVVDLNHRPMSIADRLIAEDKKRRNKILSLETRQRIENHQIDGFGFDLGDSTSKVTRFASGVLSPAYWKAYKASGRALCVAATELGNKRLERVKEHVRQGGTLLVDSGAFIYMARPDEMPWSEVARRYYEIAKAASDDAKVTFVLPDAVGDQAKSLEALQTWGDRLIRTVGARHTCLLPVQNGDLSPSEYIRKAQTLLKESYSGIALPCGAAPMPPQKLRDLLELSPGERPERIHLLGISNRKKELAKYTTVLADVVPDAEVSCDAVEFRQDVGKEELLTVMRREILEAIRDKALERADWTELSHTLSDASHVLLIEYVDNQFPLVTGEDRAELIETIQSSPIMQALETQALHNEVDERFGPYATSLATHALITQKVPKLLADYWAHHHPIEPECDQRMGAFAPEDSCPGLS